MYHNRILKEATPISLPQPPQPGIPPQTFVIVCPTILFPGMTMEQWMWQQWVYQRAFAEALAVARPSILERDLLAVWN